ncbi:Protein PDC2 [Kluyveromyces marxianus]
MGLSIEQKYNICLMAEKHPKWTQAELAQWAYQVYQLPSKPSQGTISRLLAKKSEFMNSKEHEKDSNRLRRPNNLLVHKILQEWVSQSIWNGIPVSLPVIQDTAQSVWHKIPPEYREGKGSFSHKWVANFLSRMNLSTHIIEHDMPKHPKVWYFDERSTLKQFISNISEDSLFTLDETFLAYNLPLDYAQYETNSIQKRLEVVTVMLCSNLKGTEKMNPLVIGRYENYNSFKNFMKDDGHSVGQDSHLGEKTGKRFGIVYQSNRKSWLTSTLFHDWLVAFDKRLVSDNRKIWIILDDSCSHRIINLNLQNIELIYTSANSRFLPFNWGVLEEFKARYRIQQYKALIDLQKNISQDSGDSRLLTYEQSCLTMTNAFKFIKIAWDAIPKERINATWKNSGILPYKLLHHEEMGPNTFQKNKALETSLNELCNTYSCMRKWDYSMLLHLNIENKNKNFLSLEEIIESSIVDQWEPEVRQDTLLLEDMDDLFNTFNTAPPTKRITPMENQILNDQSKLLSDQIPVTDSYGMITTSNDNQDNKISTVSELIDNNTEDIFGNMLDENFFSDELLTTIGDPFANKLNGNNEQSQTVQPPQRPQSSLSAVRVTEIPSNTSPYSDEGRSAVYGGGAELPKSHSSHSSPYVEGSGGQQTETMILPSYVNQIFSKGSSVEIENDKLVMMTTLQTNVELAKAMGTILKHSELQEVGLSEASLKEMKMGYQNCLKRITKARHFLNSMDKKRRQQNIEHQFLTSHSGSPQDSISSMHIADSFFENFAENHSTASSS